LHDRNQGEPRGVFGWLSATRKESSQVLISVQATEFISHPHIEALVGEGGLSNPNGLGGNGVKDLGME
jgi:hypothetical protein